MKKFALLITPLLFGGWSEAPGPEIPDFIHAAYSVESLLSREELAAPDYDTFRFLYLMATPDWKTIDFDQPQESINDFADRFDYSRQEGNMPLVPQMIARAHESDTKILLSFGGQKEFLPFVERPERIGRFTEYMVRLVDKNDYDGIDIDWEITLDKEIHAGMMNDLRRRLDSLARRNGRYYYLTTALSIDHVYERQLADSLARAVDWINIMSYDMCDGIWGGTPSHNTSMEVMRSRFEHWNVFAKRQLCLGLANYGFYYKGLKPGQRADCSLSHYGSYITYKKFLPLLDAGWTEEYDPVAEVSYYFSPDGNEFVTIDNPSSILNKIRWITANGYRGVFWWEFHHDYLPPTAENPRGSHYLIDVVTKYLGGR